MSNVCACAVCEQVPESVLVGSDFRVQVELQSLVDEDHQVEIKVSMVMALYTGVIYDRILSQTFSKPVKAKEGEQMMNILVLSVYASYIYLPSTYLKRPTFGMECVI